MSVVKSINGMTPQNYKTLREITNCIEMQLDFLRSVETNLRAEALARGEEYEPQWKLGAAEELARDIRGMLYGILPH